MMDVIKDRICHLGLREGLIVCLAAIVVYLFRAEDSLVLKPVWRKMLQTHHFVNKNFPSKAEHLPHPVVTDLESDGINEIILISNDLKLNVLAMPGNDGEDGQQQNALSHVKIKSSVDITVETGHRPVVMTTGFREPYQSMVQVRRQVIVVVLDDWQVLCYDADLSLLWKSQPLLTGKHAGSYSIKSMCSLVVPVSIEKGETGLVFVGGSYSHTTHSNDERPHSHRHKGHIDDSVTHFSTFALNSHDGTIKWHHLPGDFQPAAEEQDPSLGLHWKLRLQRGKHIEESVWTNFQQDIVRQLPHQWRETQDTRMTLANIQRHSMTQQTESDSTAADHIVTTESVISSLGHEHLIGYAYGGMRPHSADEHITNANSLVVHNHNGMEILNLATGRPLTRVVLSNEGSLYTDIDNDGAIEEISLKFTNTEEQNCYLEFHKTSPRQLLHSTEVCRNSQWFQVWSSSSNHDGTKVVPPISVPTVADQGGPLRYLLGHHLTHRKTQDILTYTSSGKVMSVGLFGVVHWQLETSASWNKLSRTSHGTNQDIGELFREAFHPGIQPMSLQVYGRMEHAVLLSWDMIAVIDIKKGRLISSHSLPCQPTAPSLIADFNNDGRNDVIITCPIGYIGFTLDTKTNHILTLSYASAVFLTLLLLSWCLSYETSEHTYHERE